MLFQIENLRETPEILNRVTVGYCTARVEELTYTIYGLRLQNTRTNLMKLFFQKSNESVFIDKFYIEIVDTEKLTNFRIPRRQRSRGRKVESVRFTLPCFVKVESNYTVLLVPSFDLL